MEPDGTEIFGPGNTWPELYAYVHRYAGYRYQHRDSGLAHDAASEGYLRTVRKTWTNLPVATPEDMARNWNYVKRIARLETGSFLVKEDARPELTFTTLMPDGMEADREQDFLDALFGASPHADCAESVMESDLHQRALSALRELAQQRSVDDRLDVGADPQAVIELFAHEGNSTADE